MNYRNYEAQYFVQTERKGHIRIQGPYSLRFYLPDVYEPKSFSLELADSLNRRGREVISFRFRPRTHHRRNSSSTDSLYNKLKQD